MNISNKLCSHYQNILRSDLLLKLNYSNIMEVPHLTKVMIISQVPSESIKQVSLALEILSGQKLLQTESLLLRLNPTSRRINTAFGHSSQKTARFGRQHSQIQKEADYLVRCCLRLDIMYHFIEKLITILRFHDYKTQIQANTIEVRLKSNLLRLFPEIQHYIELFETVQNVQIIIFTSARTEKETHLLWTGFSQK